MTRLQQLTSEEQAKLIMAHLTHMALLTQGTLATAEQHMAPPQAPHRHRSVHDNREEVRNDPDHIWSDCWTRPCIHVEPLSVQDFNDASRAARLNAFQQHATTLTGEHRLVLVRGPPGMGKTQLSAAVIDAWARVLARDEMVIAAGPSNTATDNLLDRIADLKGRDFTIGRLGGGSSVFDHLRIQFSLTERAKLGAGKDAKKPVINRMVEQAITERKHAVIFTTYMKSAELIGASTIFILADEAGQATEPTAAVLLANAVDGGHVMIVGDEHGLAPTVRDQRAEWDGLGCSLLHGTTQQDPKASNTWSCSRSNTACVTTSSASQTSNTYYVRRRPEMRAPGFTRENPGHPMALRINQQGTRRRGYGRGRDT